MSSLSLYSLNIWLIIQRSLTFVMLILCFVILPSHVAEGRGTKTKRSERSATKKKRSEGKKRPRSLKTKTSERRAKNGTKAKKRKNGKRRKKGNRGRKYNKKKTPKKARRKRQRYQVVRGDTWSSVAKVLKVKTASLKRWNRRVQRRRLKPGQKIIFYGPLRQTESVGRPNRGTLKNGIHLDPDGDGLGRGIAVSKHRPDLWGTPELIGLVRRCGRSYRRYFSRKYAPIPIGDLSRRRGGPLKEHKSHQSGRDVDVGYMRKKPLAKGYFKDTPAKHMNMYAQWVVLKCFLDDPQTQMVFIERSRVRAIKRYIKRIYKTRKPKLKRYLRYFSRGTHKKVFPDSVHKSHMHVRIHCPKGDKRCRT